MMYAEPWKKFATFAGRSRRSEYWTFALVNFGISCVLGGLAKVVPAVFILSSLFGLAAFLPGLAVAVRRLHDTGRSGWWVLIAFIPLIGAIALIIFMCLDSQPGGNQYGANPKGA